MSHAKMGYIHTCEILLYTYFCCSFFGLSIICLFKIVNYLFKNENIWYINNILGVERHLYWLRCPSVCLMITAGWVHIAPQRAGVHKLIKISRIFKNISLRLDIKFASQAVWEKLTLCILWHSLLIPTLLAWHCSLPLRKFLDSVSLIRFRENY